MACGTPAAEIGEGRSRRSGRARRENPPRTSTEHGCGGEVNIGSAREPALGVAAKVPLVLSLSLGSRASAHRADACILRHPAGDCKPLGGEVAQIGPVGLGFSAYGAE